MKFLFYTSGVFLILIGSYIVVAPYYFWEFEYKSACLLFAEAKCPLMGMQYERFNEWYRCGSCAEVLQGKLPRLGEFQYFYRWVSLVGIPFLILGVGIFVWKTRIFEWVDSFQNYVVARCSLSIVSALSVVFGLLLIVVTRLYGQMWIPGY